MQRVVVHVVTGALLHSLVVGLAAAQSEETSPELMLFEDIPKLVAATRTERSVRDVPSAVSVISADEIRASGATSLQQLLQTVPGLDFMQITRGDLNVASRGFVAPTSTSLLVMIDERSVYLDFFGITLWEHLNVTLQDIERIEIVRGPGSALYGANAFAGTINIVTRRARDLPRLTLRSGAGPDIAFGSATGAGHSGRLAIKGSVEYRRRDEFRNVANPAPNTDHTRHDRGPLTRLLNATVEYATPGGAELRFALGSARARGGTLTAVGTFDSKGPETYAKLDLRRGPWKAHAFYTRLKLDLATVVALGPPTPLAADLLSTVLDFDLQRTLEWRSHEVLAGFNLRRIATDSSVVLGSREEETLYAGFFQDVFRLRDDLTGFVGLRLDEHPKSGFQVSPRAALVYKFSESGRVRASFARSFQNPTHIDNYSSFAASPLFSVVGNEDLDPVWLTAWELGVQLQPKPRLRAQVDFFFNVVKDFQALALVAPGPPAVLSFTNTGRTKVWGGELALEWLFGPSLRAFGSYSFQSANGPLEQSTPRGKASLGLRGSIGSKFRYSFTGIYTAHSELEPGALASATLLDLDVSSRFTVDGFVGVQLREGVELGLHARNLFHQVRRQFPLGDEIGSELLVTLNAEF